MIDKQTSYGKIMHKKKVLKILILILPYDKKKTRQTRKT